MLQFQQIGHLMGIKAFRLSPKDDQVGQYAVFVMTGTLSTYRNPGFADEPYLVPHVHLRYLGTTTEILDAVERESGELWAGLDDAGQGLRLSIDDLSVRVMLALHHTVGDLDDFFDVMTDIRVDADRLSDEAIRAMSQHVGPLRTRSFSSAELPVLQAPADTDGRRRLLSVLAEHATCRGIPAFGAFNASCRAMDGLFAEDDLSRERFGIRVSTVGIRRAA